MGGIEIKEIYVKRARILGFKDATDVICSQDEAPFRGEHESRKAEESAAFLPYHAHAYRGEVYSSSRGLVDAFVWS